MPLPTAKLTSYEKERPSSSFKIQRCDINALLRSNFDRRIKDALEVHGVAFKQLDGGEQYVVITYRGERRDTQAMRVLTDAGLTLL